VLQCVAVCCSVLQCVAVCCSVLQCVVAYCNVLHCGAMLKVMELFVNFSIFEAITSPKRVAEKKHRKSKRLQKYHKHSRK